MQEREILKIFKDSGAILKGHFKLSSGLHSSDYLQCALVLQFPGYTEKLCRDLANHFKADRPTCIIAPALGGIVVSYEVARLLGARSIFTEREAGKMTFRRGFKVFAEDRVLVVEDVITTGLSTNEVIEVVRSSGAKLVGVGSIVNRSGKDIDFGVKSKSLIKLNLPNFFPETCPLCKKGIELVKPGSRQINNGQRNPAEDKRD